MTDLRLRELERRWRELGTDEAQADWLRERIRGNDITRDRVVLAASLGHSAAALVVEAEIDSPDDDPAWLKWLDRFGNAPRICVYTLSARIAFDFLATTGSVGNPMRPALEFCEVWCGRRDLPPESDARDLSRSLRRKDLGESSWIGDPYNGCVVMLNLALHSLAGRSLPLETYWDSVEQTLAAATGESPREALSEPLRAWAVSA